MFINGSGCMTKMAAMSIYGNLQNQKTDDIETLHTASETEALQR